MVDPSQSVPRRMFLLALIASTAGCGDGGTQTASPEVANKKAKKFEEAKAELQAKKGKPGAPPVRSPNGRPR